MLRSDSATPIDDRVTAAITVNRKPDLDRFGTIAATVAWLFYYGRRHDDENVADPWRDVCHNALNIRREHWIVSRRGRHDDVEGEGGGTGGGH